MLLELSLSLTMSGLGSPQVCTGPTNPVIQGHTTIITCTCSAVTEWKSDHGGQVEGIGAVTARFDSTNVSPGLVTITPKCSGNVHANPVLIVVASVPAAPFVCVVTVPSGTIHPGDIVTVTSTPVSIDPNKHAVFTWALDGHKISGSSSVVSINTTGFIPGSYMVTGHVSQGPNPGDSADCKAPLTISPAPPPPP